MEPENPALDLYLLDQVRARRPRVCFLPTASGEADRYVAHFYSTFSRFDCRLSHLTFFHRTPDLKSHLLNQDVIYVGGENTKSMLAIWKEWGVDLVLKEAWKRGVLLAGISAGAICWFEQGLTDSHAGGLTVLDCLGFLKGSCAPHYDGEAERRPTYHHLLLRGRIVPGYALDDGAAVHFIGNQIHRVVVSRPKAKAYYVRLRHGSIEEKPFQVELLGRARPAHPRVQPMRVAAKPLRVPSARKQRSLRHG